MIKCGQWPIGICNWSLQNDVLGTSEAMLKLGVDHVHLDLRPVCETSAKEYL